MKPPAPGNAFRDTLAPSGEYSLAAVALEVPNPTTAIFRATLNGPPGAPVWARAWLSTEAGTLAEAASSQLVAGEQVTLAVRLQSDTEPQSAYMRIESAPLKTEHVVRLDLTAS